MNRKPIGRHRVSAAPRLTLDRIVERLHDDLQDRLGLVSR